MGNVHSKGFSVEAFNFSTCILTEQSNTTNDVAYSSSLPVVVPAYGALENQNVIIDESASKLLFEAGASFIDPILNYSHSPEFWCGLLRSGVHRGWLSNRCIEQAIAGGTTAQAHNMFLNAIDSELQIAQKEIETVILRNNIKSDQKIVNYINDNFAYSLEISIDENIVHEHAALRLTQDNSTLSILELDYILELPQPLKSIGVMLTSVIVALGLKSMAHDVIGGVAECSYLADIIDELSSDNLALLVGIISSLDIDEIEPDISEQVNAILSSIDMSIESMNDELGDCWFTAVTEYSNSIISVKAICDLNEVSGLKPIQAIDIIITKIKNIKANYRQISFSDEFKRFENIAAILKTFCVDDPTLDVENGSDAYLPEYSMTTFNSDLDSEAFESINNSHNEIDEIPSFIIPISNESFLVTLKNIVLSDSLFPLLVNPL